MVKSASAFCLTLMLAIARPGDAHPLHSSFTEITRQRGGMISISIRLFADDFGVALDALRAAPGAPSETVAQQYFARSVVLTTADGKPVQLVWCGMRTVDGLVWLCARSAQPIPAGFVQVRNALMFDRFADQISVVRWQNTSQARTVVLSARSPVATLD